MELRVYTNEMQYDETAFEYYTGGIQAGKLWKITDPESFTTEHQYDSTCGTLSKVITAGDNGSNNVHQTHYTARGDLEHEINANGIKTAYGYNANRQRTETIQHDESDAEVARYVRTFDANGDLVVETGPEGFEKRYAYNPFKKITHAWTANDTADPNDDPVVTYEYDERDWLVKTTDPMGRETTTTYYPNKQVKTVSRPLTASTVSTIHYTYGENGEQETVTGPLGWTVKTINDITNRTTTVTEPYKGISGDPAAVPDGTPSVTKTFDKAGQMTRLLNRRGNEFELGYNTKGAATDFYTPLRKHTETAYTPRGAVDTVTEPSGQETAYSYYLASGRLKETEDDVGATHYTYDPAGNVTVVSNQASAVSYAYDHAGRVTNLNSQVSGFEFQLSYSYDAAGRMTKLVYPDDKEVTYVYYTNNLLKTVGDWANRVTAYEYYPDGRLSKITRPNGTVRTQAYALDGKLARVEERTSDNHLIALYQYNYNANGTLESRFSLPQPQAYKLPTQTFTHDADNRIATIIAEGQDLGSTTFDHDGNLLSNPAGGDEPTNFVYNARNYLTSVAGGSSSTSTVYTYDVAGNRIASTVAGGDDPGTTTFVINPSASLSQVLVREKNGQKTFYVYGLGLQYEVNDSDEAKYYHYDLIGSTAAISDDSGLVTDRIEYSPYGTVTHRAGVTDTPFLYVGKYGVQTDPNGLLYMRARYYSPTLRRFLNSDPIGFGGGLNFFAYAGGNPNGYIDPSGHAPKVWSVTSPGGGFVNAGYSPDIDWGDWDSNGGGKGWSPPWPAGELAVVAIPAIVLGVTVAVLTAPEWGPSALMLGGGVGSMAGTRMSQFYVNNPWALPTLNAVNWIVNDLSNYSSPSKIEAGKWYLDQAGGKAWDKFTDHFGAPNAGVGGLYGPRAEFVDNLKSGSEAMGGNAQINNSLEAQTTTIPVGGAGKTPKP